jgi:6-phosphofructokinase
MARFVVLIKRQVIGLPGTIENDINATNATI